MIKHIVFFKIAKYSSPEDKKKQVKKLEEIFSPLGKIFKFIPEFRTGVNFTDDTAAWDFVIDSTFKSKEDLHRYMVSEEHVAAVKTASAIEKTKAVIDYEI